VITPEGTRAASIHISDGRITRVAPYDDTGDSTEIYEADAAVVMPGIVDTHVHVNEPGRTEWEGFETGTRAAAAGGVTTILDMPLNSIPATTNVEALEAKRDSARGKSIVNVEFIGGVVPGNAREIEPLARAGVRAFKCFLAPSGVDEFPNVSEGDLRVAFPALARMGLPLMVHAEDPACLIEPHQPSEKYSDYLASRPVEAEHSAIEMIVKLLEWCPTPVHIVHLSSATSLDIIRRAKDRGLPLTVETCPHYLTFAAEEIPDSATEYKCAPPIRSAAEREALWDALINGDIDLIASDHSPCLPSMKDSDGNFFGCWGGIASLQLSLAAVWTGAVARGVAIEKVVEWMSAAPARLAGLADRKGAISSGYDADIIVVDAEHSWTVDPRALFHRHPVTPYAGRELRGIVRSTFVSGRVAYSNAKSA
jgi:allantoinase